jgi:VanZ family protein
MSFPADPPATGFLYWRRVWLAVGWLLVVAVILLSLIRLPLDLPHAQGDKSGHVVAYAVLMFWFAQLYAAGARRTAIAIALLVLGCGLEVVQSAVGRDFEYADMLANGLGIVLGWLAAPPRTPHLLARIEACFVAKVRR